MLKFERPSENSSFASKVETLKKDVLEAIQNDKKPSFPDAWGDYKGEFFETQENKCGYCETQIDGEDGDVEHYRPKKCITELSDDQNDWGNFCSKTNRVKGRVMPEVCKNGYWWEAYDWSNYLLSCSVCNKKYKKNLFPIIEKRIGAPKESDKETPLLLNPFESSDLEKKLEYDELGVMKQHNDNKSGFETIKTCGLNRHTLVKSRKEKANLVHYKLGRLDKVSKEHRLDLLHDIYKAGAKDASFAGMVRIIYQQISGSSWDELKKIVEG